jgi:hypothetical protein
MNVGTQPYHENSYPYAICHGAPCSPTGGEPAPPLPYFQDRCQGT